MFELEAQLRAYGVVLDRAEAAVTDVEAVPPRMRRSYVVAIAAAIVVVLAVSGIAVGTRPWSGSHVPNVVTPGSTTPTSLPAVGAGVLAIGDSVMLGARDALENAIPGIAVDAVTSRQFSQAPSILQEYAARNALPGTIVVDLGTNGRATTNGLDAIMRATGQRPVYFLTVRVPRSWEAGVNAALNAMPDRWPNAHVIDWHEYANGHDDWFVTDGFHLTPRGQQAYSLLIASEIGVQPKTTTTTVPSGNALPVVEVITKPALPPDPLAVAAGEVWIATEPTGDAPFVRLEGRDPSTAKVVSAIDLTQEAVFSVAGDGDTLWVAGGGDGGVPETTVSRVDARTKRIVFTKTLTGTPCSCQIVAGPAGVWLAGNGSGFALHLSPADGHVVGRVDFPGLTVGAVAEAGRRLLVGLDDGSIAVIDPDTDRIEHSIPLPAIGDPPEEHAVAMNAAAIPAVGSDSPVDALVARAGGDVDALSASGWQVNSFLAADFRPTTVVTVGAFAWVLGADRLEVSSTHAEVNSEFSYDPKHGFARSPAGFGSQPFGFRDAVAAGDTLWAVYDPGAGNGEPSIVVVRTTVGLP